MGCKSKKCNCSIKPIEHKRDNEYEVRDGILYRRDKPYGVVIEVQQDMESPMLKIQAVLIGQPGKKIGVLMNENKIE